MAGDEKGPLDVDWSYPNLLTRETLLKAIKLRFIDRPDLDSLDKNGLVEIYNRFLLPLPQRKYRSNRRGILMTKKQIVLAKMIKTETNENTKVAAEEEKPMPRFMASYTPSTQPATPVKPPESCINFERKTIKLNSRSSSSLMDTSQSPTSDKETVSASPEDVKDSPEDVKHSPGDVKDSPKDVKDSPKDVKDSSEDVKDSSEDMKDSSEDMKDSPEDVKDENGTKEKSPEPIIKDNNCSKKSPLSEENSSSDVKKRPAENSNNDISDCDEPAKKKKVIPRITWP